MVHFPSVLDHSRRIPLVAEGVAGTDPRVSWLDPGIGEWWIDPSLCYYDRSFPVPPAADDWNPLNRQGRRPTSGAGGIGVGKWVLVPEGEGLRSMFFFGNGPDSPTTPMMQYFATLDGTPWADPHSTLLPGQLAQLWRLDPRMTVRLVLNNRTPEHGRFEWAVYAPSTDGKVFACTSWDAATPDRHNLQVFRKHLGSVYNRDGLGAPEAVVTRGGAPARLRDDDPLFGTWLIDESRSSFLRAGQDIADSRPAVIARQKLVFRRNGDWVSGTTFATPGSDEPNTRSSWRFDAIEYPEDETGDRTATWWMIDPQTIIRRGRVGGVTREWSLHALSEDKAMLAVTSWDQDRPYDRDIEVFRKV